MRAARLLLAVEALLCAGCGRRTASQRQDVVAPAAPPCAEPVPVFTDGRQRGTVCPDEATARGLTVVDLSDAWVPRLFRRSPGAEVAEPAYAASYRALADGRGVEGPAWARARADRFLEVFGIFPTPRVLAARLLDKDRHACHAGVDPAPIAALDRSLEPFTLTRPRAQERLALAALDARLVCDGLLPATTRPRPRWRLADALAAYQRQHMVVSAGMLDAETRRTLLESPLELDFRALLRTLRARVVDATGLIEDGSASTRRAQILGRRVDGEAYLKARDGGTSAGAPDLISPATEAAARALGWVDPAAAVASFERADRPLQRVAVRLPPLPAYHTQEMALRAVIDRGDLWYALPGRRGPIERRPTLTLYVRTAEGERALVRWPTTVGGWKKERGRWGDVGLRFKESEVGRRLWRDVVAAPAWLPPPTTPIRTMVRRDDDGRWVADGDLVGPGYASAYGLVMLVHHQRTEQRGQVRWFDNGIRTHGSVSYPSVLRGESHGCHRLFNHSAIQLASFLLQHRRHVVAGEIDKPFTRVFAWKGRRLKLPIPSRGYRYELTPPVEVEVLEGRVHGRPKISRRLVRL